MFGRVRWTMYFGSPRKPGSRRNGKDTNYKPRHLAQSPLPNTLVRFALRAKGGIPERRCEEYYAGIPGRARKISV